MSRGRTIDLVLRAASRLVPSRDRGAWLQEWRAEFQHLEAGRRARDSQARTRVSSRLAMAFRHAWWLRWNPPATHLLLPPFNPHFSWR